MATNNLQILKKEKPPAPSASSEDEDEIYNDVHIRVGSSYQADIPELLSQPENKHKQRPKSLLVWFPPKNISEVELNDYILFSKNKHGYNTEQCLGLLYWNKHNLKKSIHDLPMYTPYSNWSILDKSNFESAFNKFGKNFVQIAKMLPDKPLKSIIGYYYLWKKKKTGRYSVKPSNKLEHFCATKIQIGSGEKPSSAKSKPVNMMQFHYLTILLMHKKIKLDILYIETVNLLQVTFFHCGVLHDMPDTIKGTFIISLTTNFIKNSHGSTYNVTVA